MFAYLNISNVRACSPVVVNLRDRGREEERSVVMEERGREKQTRHMQCIGEEVRKSDRCNNVGEGGEGERGGTDKRQWLFTSLCSRLRSL